MIDREPIMEGPAWDPKVLRAIKGSSRELLVVRSMASPILLQPALGQELLSAWTRLSIPCYRLFLPIILSLRSLLFIQTNDKPAASLLSNDQTISVIPGFMVWNSHYSLMSAICAVGHAQHLCLKVVPHNLDTELCLFSFAFVIYLSWFRSPTILTTLQLLKL